MALTEEETQRYARQLLLPEIGSEGQEKLKNASVLCVGAGGLGSPVLLYLAAAGVGTLGIVDRDRVERSNLQRQILHDTPHLGEDKTASAVRRIRDLNPNVNVKPYQIAFSQENGEDLVRPYDLVVDACDNFRTRLILGRASLAAGRPMVHGAVTGYQGHVSVFDPGRGTPCYRCLFPEDWESSSFDANPSPGILGAAAGVVGSFQAMEVIKLVTGIGEPLTGKLLSIDVLKGRLVTVPLQKNAQCPCCGD